MSSTHSQRRGFTLVELLVVIAIIGILVGMLLPAIQSVREAARRATCLNNIRQVVLACHIYESGNQRFPPGSSAPTGGDLYGESMLVPLLPFIEQVNLYDDLRASGISPALPRLAALSNARVPLFMCSSATQEDELVTIADQGTYTSHYYGSLGDYFTQSTTFPVAATGGGGGVAGYSGMFSPWSSVPTAPNGESAYYTRTNSKKFGDVRDGASNTVAMIEKSRSSNSKGAVPYTPVYPGWGFGHQAIAPGTNPPPAARLIVQIFSSNSVGVNQINQHAADGSPVHGPGAYGMNQLPMGSNHPGGALVAMVDGSSTFVSDQVTLDIIRAMTGIRDGVTAAFE
ncbi:MAG: DUF1559 domain-containing protein [Mariniblastus sp.]